MKDTVTVRESEVRTGNQTQRVTEVNDPAERNEHGSNVAQRIIWYVVGVVVSLLLIRFVFALLGANEGNGFASFIYSVTSPLVAPFTGLFSFDGVQYGISKLEAFTLVAAVIYTLVGFGLAKLFDLTRR
jgi:uncharacterized protein YggT (Ycf19 family)